MKRRLKLEVHIDYDKLMKEDNVEIVEKGYCSEKEEEIISKVIGKIKLAIPLINEISYCIEDYIKKEIEEFERSSKMSSALSKHCYYD